MGEKLTESITVKLSPTETHQLKCLAAEEGLSWAEYMRGLLAGDVQRAQQRYQALSTMFGAVGADAQENNGGQQP